MNTSAWNSASLSLTLYFPDLSSLISFQWEGYHKLMLVKGNFYSMVQHASEMSMYFPAT